MLMAAAALFFVSDLFMPIAFASNTDGTIDTTYKYAWGENIGWINFGTTEGNVHITDSVMTGYAWSENIGWIPLNCSNDNSCNAVNYKISNNGNGVLSGYSYSADTGYINFAPTNGGVTISSSGELQGYAWGENIGWMVFNCATTNSCGTADYKVKTDWRPQNARPACNNTLDDDGDGRIDYPSDSGCNSLEGTTELPVEGTVVIVPGGGSTSGTSTSSSGGTSGGTASDGTTPSVTPPTSITSPMGESIISINDNAQETDNRNVSLLLKGDANIKTVWISEKRDFPEGLRVPYTSPSTRIQFIISEEEGPKTIFAKFCTAEGQCSGVISDTITFKGKESIVKLPPPKTEPEFEIPTPTIEEPVKPAKPVIKPVIRPVVRPFAKPIAAKPAVEPATEPTVVEPIIEPAVVDPIIRPTIAPLSEPMIGPVAPVVEPAAEPATEPAESTTEPTPSVEPPTPVIVPEIAAVPEVVQPSIPTEAPPPMQGGWELLSQQPMGTFTPAPLPQEVSVFVEKFPDLKSTFNSIGVSDMTDIENLKNTQFVLPGLTASVGLPKDTPIELLSKEDKKILPSEVVFVKTGNGFIDFNSTLNVTNKGESRRKITSIVGKPLELVIKVDKPVKSVTGYIVYKSRKTQNASYSPSRQLMASLISVADAAEEKKIVEERMVLQKFEYTDPDGDGIYTTNITAPLVGGEFEIITVMNYEDPTLEAKEVKLVTVIDPEGYIYEKSGNKETRIPGAIATLYWLNPETKQYELWPADKYQQENPQTTGTSGAYSFLAPEGFYYIKVEAPGYLAYNGKPFQLKKDNGIHTNIELSDQYWWVQVFDWKTILLILVTMLLLYNLYRNRMIESAIKNLKP